MINKIAKLSDQLRQQGLPVSVRSTQSAVQIHMSFGETDRMLLKRSLMAVYVKDKYDIPKFNKVVDEIDVIHGATVHACPVGLEYDHDQQLDE